MQGKFFNDSFISSMDFEKVENLRQIYDWVRNHTELCHLYTNMACVEDKLKYKNEIESSLVKGKILMDSIFSESIQNHRKPLIPLSGVNRFSATLNDSLSISKFEVVSNPLNGYLKSEITGISNVKKVPMPSRTYLKKK